MSRRTEDDKTSTHSCSHGTAANGLEGHEHEGSEENTTDSREQSHGDIWDTGLEVVLANVLEVEVTIETSQPTGQGDEHLGQGRVDVHEELALEVLGSETTEAVDMAVSR